MRRGTTPTNTFTVDTDLTTAVAVFVTYRQGGQVLVEKSIDDLTITSTAVEVTLTQEDTLAFAHGTVQMQIRAKFRDGAAIASNIIIAPVDQILKDGVI